jgi:predicted ATPase/class 3 adenylate cyclase
MSARTYTFLFTDIEGSTRFWERQPEQARAALEQHNKILREAIETQGGRVFRTAGDAFFASFNTASPALAAAVEAQNRFYEETWNLESPLRVRMALHTGEAEEQNGDYVGASLNRIGRLISVSNGGQILLTQAVQELVRDNLPKNTVLHDLGRHRFRDLESPERIFQVAIDGLPYHFPPLKSLETIPNNLPRHLTSFIGREAELAKAQELLSTNRLLNLTGPGGTGKTRLAVQTAASRLEDFPDGVWLVELAPLNVPSMILPSIAGVLNIRELPETPLIDSVREALRTRRLLLVLDNCEHLIEACAQIADELLQACPDLKIMVSSREVLDVPGEITMRVPPLSLPNISVSASVNDLLKSEAVQLFIERARAIQPNFQLTDQNAHSVAKICQRVDGIPLAIELAAARLRLLNPEQIAARLDDLFRLLTGGSRTALPRQQTLEAMIDWSHELLSDPERVLFRRLAVFSGDWTLEAAEVVCAGEEPAAGAGVLTRLTEPVLDLLTQLVNKSLVLVDDYGSEVCYRLLETIRQYAQIKLVETGEATLARQAHHRYFREFSSKAYTGLQGEDQYNWMKRLERDHDNLRSALEWGLEHDPLSALEMGADLVYFWSGRGYSSEGRRWLKSSLDNIGKMDELGGDHEKLRIAARAFSAYGQMAIIQGDNTAAREALERAVQIQREQRSLKELVLSIPLLSLAFLFLGDIEKSLELAEEGERLGRELDEPIGLALSLSLLAQISMRVGSGYDNARDKIEESARLLRVHGNRWFSALSLMGLGIIAYLARDLSTAEANFMESVEIFQKAGDLHFTNVSHSYLADVARQKGEFERAARLYREILQNWLKFGHRGGLARCVECLAFLKLAKAGQRASEEDTKYLEKAGLMLGWAESIREASGSGMTIDEQMEYYALTNSLRARLSQESELEALFEKAWKKGRQMGQDEILALAF